MDSNINADGETSQFDARSEYSTASTVRTASSSSSPSIFSSTHGGDDSASSVGQSSAPSSGYPPLSFAQQFAAGPLGPGPGAELWCEFSELMSCPATFRLDDQAGWIQHHVVHLGYRFPRQLMCWFCDDVPFVVGDPADAAANFYLRMQHIRQHIIDEHLTSEDVRPDFFVVTHLHAIGRLGDRMFKHAMSFDETPEQYRLRRPYSPEPTLAAARRDNRVQIHDPESERRAERRKKRERRRSHGHHQEDTREERGNR